MAYSHAAANAPLQRTASFRLLAVCVLFGLASLAWGYNIGVMASIYVHPGFIKALHKPSKSITGLITSIYYLGTYFSYLFLGHPLADRYGRRVAAAAGIAITGIGSVVQACAKPPSGLVSMILGRIICGVGLAIVSTSVPVYQSEVSPAKYRGRYVVINHVGLVAGMAVAFWVGFGLSNWETERGNYYGWRLSMALQLVPELIFLMGVFLCPETPRWLVEHGRSEAARRSLAWLRDLPPSHKSVVDELRGIEQDVETRRATTGQSWTVLFTDRPLWNRLWRAWLLCFMGPMAGNTSMKYYLPTIFGALGIERKLALMIGGIEHTLKIACTVFDSWLVDRFGRRLTLLWSCLIMSFALLLNGALPTIFPHNVNRVADWICVLFIFVYTFGFSIGFGPAAWVYGSEIFPTNFRARGLNIAASGGSIASVISSQTWPVGMQSIGPKTHFIFMTFNLMWAVVIYFFYPETSRRSLEDMEALFNPDFKPRTDLETEAERYYDDEDNEVDNTIPRRGSGQATPLQPLLQDTEDRREDSQLED